MAVPTITRLSRTATNTDNYWGNNSGVSANHDRAVRGGSNRGAHLYAIDAGTTNRYTYAELFTALNSHADWTATIGATDFDVADPTREISVSYGVTGHFGVLMIRSGVLFHEIPGSSDITFANNAWMPIIGAPATVDNTGDALADVGVTYIHSGLGTDNTAWTGSHEITLGYVQWRQAQQLESLTNYPEGSGNFNSETESNGSIRPVDGGFPQKVGNSRDASALKASLAFFCPADGQSCTITDNRLDILFARGSTTRQDFDMAGSGRIVAHFSIKKTGTAAGFGHNVATNPNNNILLNTYEDIDNSNRRVISGAFEYYSIQPDQAVHPYIGSTLRANAPIEVLHRTETANGGQAQLTFTGAGNFNVAANRTGITLQAVRGNLMRYWQGQWASGNVTEMLWLDPSFQITASNTPIDISEDTGSTQDKQIVMLRSVGVNNQDAAGNPKSSVAYVFGNQKSATTRTYDSTWITSVIPQVRSHANGGTWTVRPTDQAGAGLDQVVGRGAHYLIDAVLHDGVDGQTASHYTRYTDVAAGSQTGNNESWLLHRGGLHRYSSQVGLRTENWNFRSNGATGTIANNQVDDLPGLGNAEVNLFRYTSTLGVAAFNFSFPSAVSSGATTFTIQAQVGDTYTATTAELIVGSTITATGIPANTTVTAATRLSASQMSITVSAATTASISANATGSADHRGYQWTINSSGTFIITMTAAKTLTYTGFCALIQAQLENIMERKQANHGVETAFISTTHNPRIEANTTINTLLDRMSSIAADGSYFKVGSSAGRITLDRVSVTATSTNTLTLQADSSNTFLDLGSSLAIWSNVSLNSAYRDSSGSPSFIVVNFPSGVTTSDLNVSVGYELDGNVQPWRIGANPSVALVGSNMTILVPENVSSEATGNTDDVWYLSITGPKTRDFRAQYTGVQDTTITLVEDLNYVSTVTPSSAATKVGDVRFTPLSLNNLGTSTEAINTNQLSLANGTTYPKNYIDATDRLALDFFGAGSPVRGYDELESQSRIRRDVADAKNSNAYSDYILVHGVDPGGNLIGTGTVDTNATHYRVLITETSRAQYLLMDDAVPDKTTFRVHIATGKDGFFGFPNFSLPAVAGSLQSQLDTQTSTLQGNISDSALGIP